MIEWPLILLGGILGSSHCLGMCGPFAVMIGAGSKSWSNGLTRQLLYSVGRISTYAFGGAVAGFIGMQLARWSPAIGSVQGILSIAAGLLLIAQGLIAGGFLSFATIRDNGASCSAASIFSSFLRNPEPISVFVAGILTGFLPCGLVYAYLSLAAATGTPLKGLAVMAVFGSGTIPLMALIGTGARLFSLASRTRMFRIAACCVILTGLLTLARGAISVRHSARGEATRCPACAESAGETRMKVGL